jgi:hypothetical protein
MVISQLAFALGRPRFAKASGSLVLTALAACSTHGAAPAVRHAGFKRRTSHLAPGTTSAAGPTVECASQARHRLALLHAPSTATLYRASDASAVGQAAKSPRILAQTASTDAISVLVPAATCPSARPAIKQMR